MGLLRKNVVPVYLFEEKEVQDVYVGTEVEAVYYKTIHAVVQPADSKFTSEVYGERAVNMFTVLCHAFEKVKLGQLVSFTGTKEPTHKIISVKHYAKHIVLTAEAVI